MSAFLCTPEHVGTLAQYYVATVRQRGGDDDECSRVGMLLGRANLDSIRARYPDTKSAADWLSTSQNDGEYLAQCSWEANRLLRGRRPRFYFEGMKGHARMLRLAQCFDYQACETGDAWVTSEAAAIVRAIFAHAAGLLADRELGDEFVWSYDEPEAQAVAS